MQNKTKRLVSSLLVATLLAGSAAATTSAFDLGRVLGGVVKVGGIGYVVDRFSDQLNSFINKLMLKNNVETEYATKVVPIISFGDSGYIGAAQVIGPQSLVEQVEAVAQVEANFNDRLFRIKGLVPVDSKNPTNLSRVDGVGVSAVIDVRF
ncbi:MAG: hypothetical protein MR209_06775 [Veillonellaceae bacterium]|nr:hypothetical protein [Veillonellaceae bacterium]